MKRAWLSGICAGLGILLLASMTQAAMIDLRREDMFNPAQQDFEDYFANQGYNVANTGYSLTWDPGADPDHRAPSDPAWRPGSAPAYQNNPDGLKFQASGTGGGGGGTGGGGAGGTISSYVLGNTKGGAWQMDFSVLLFDPNFDGDGAKITLRGDDPTNPQNSYTKVVDNKADINDGKMFTFEIQAAANEEVDVVIEFFGDESWVAGYFANEYDFAAIPEPATLALLMVGAGGVLAARRRSR